jgi:hypothetical protein
LAVDIFSTWWIFPLVAVFSLVEDIPAPGGYYYLFFIFPACGRYSQLVVETLSWWCFFSTGG